MIDARALAAFRILLGLVAFVNTVNILGIFDYVLTDEYTLLPLRFGLQVWPESSSFSLFFLGGGNFVGALLLLISLIFSICLTIGWHTRKSSFVCWLISRSFVSAAPLFDYPGVKLLNNFLFLACFADLDLFYSI